VEGKTTLLFQTFGSINPDWQLSPSLVFAVGEVLYIFELPTSPGK